MKGRLAVLLAALLVATAAATVAAAKATVPTASSLARLVRITSPVPRGELATLTARVVPRRLCSIGVYYKSGRSTAQGLYPKRPIAGRVRWTWKVGTRTTPGRWPIRVSCGSAGSFRTSFVVTR
jgi:hypothetical protein